MKHPENPQRPETPEDRHLLEPLRQGIVLLYWVTTCLVVATLSWISYRDYRATLQDAERQSVSLARSLSEHATRSLISVEQAMQNVGEDIQRAGGIDKLDERWVHERLKEKVQLTPQIRAVIVIDSNGILKAHGLEYPTRQIALGDREYFLYHKTHDSLLPRIGDPIISRTDGKWLIPVTRRLNTADGSFNGLMLSGVEPNYFLHFYKSLQIADGTRITLMRPDGMVILNYPFNIDQLGHPAVPPPAPKESGPRFERIRDSNGDNFVAELRGDDSIPLVVRVTTSASQVFARYQLESVARLGIAALLLVVVTVMRRLLMRQIDRIRSSESRLRLTQFTVDESPDMILWCDRSGALLYTNNALVTSSGYSEATLRTMRFGELFFGREMRWERILGVIQNAGRLVSEPQLKRADGSTLPVEITMARMEFYDDSLLCVTARDITERKRADEELRQHRDNLQDMVNERTAEVRTMLDASPLAVALSLRSSLLVVNPAFKHLFGYEETEIVGRHESLLYLSENRYREARRAMKTSIVRGETFRSEIELCRKDGSTFWADLFARALVPESPGRGVILIIDDITAKRAAALALRHSEHIRRAVLDTTVDGFALVDTTRRFVEVNPAFCTQVGRPREALIGRAAQSVLGDALAERLFPAASNAESGVTHEIELPGTESPRPFLAHSGELVGAHGELEYRFAFLTDISHQKRIERTLTVAKETAEAANQAKTTFLTNMSHELRTPMHAIMSFSQIGAEKAEATGATALLRNFQRIHLSGKRLLNLINALLDMSQLEARKMSYSTDRHILQHTLRGALTELSALFAERELTLEVNDSAPELSADYDDARITQVIINLLSNAIKFSPARSTIEVGFIEDVRLGDGPSAIGLSVRDHGPGIPEEDIERIFDTFVQVGHTPLPGSTGLGLSISRSIVLDHHGQLFARNHPQGGAVFTMLLPAKEQKTPTGGNGEAAASDPTSTTSA